MDANTMGSNLDFSEEEAEEYRRMIDREVLQIDPIPSQEELDSAKAYLLARSMLKIDRMKQERLDRMVSRASTILQNSEISKLKLEEIFKIRDIVIKYGREIQDSLGILLPSDLGPPITEEEFEKSLERIQEKAQIKQIMDA